MTSVRTEAVTEERGTGTPAAHTTASGAREPVVIEPARGWARLNLAELAAYRGLFVFLVWRDVKVRYAQTVLGAAWAVLQPVLTMVLFTIIFGRFAGIPSDGVPYPIFALTSLVAWTYFSTAVGGASESLVSSANLLTKVYFPRLIIPFAPVLAGLVDFAIGFVVLLALMLAYGMVPSAAALVLVPLVAAALVLTAAGVGCWLAALNVQYRDVRYAVPFLLQIWLFASPIVYPMSIVPEQYRGWYALNPMAGVIEGLRSVLLRTNVIAWPTLSISLLAAVVVFVTGIYYFQRMEARFADVA